MTAPSADPPSFTLSVPEIRDYDRINAELAQRLDEGHTHVRLAGAEGQRLLLARLTGIWNALVEVEGRVGPEFAAELNSPGLTVICRGDAADGAATGMRAGRVLILGNAGVAVGYAQVGGTIVVSGAAGPRAGLGQRGGNLALLSDVGQLVAERQSGGRIFVFTNRLGKHAERGKRGGRLIRLASSGDPLAAVDTTDATAFRELERTLQPWVTLRGSAL
jgi:glutamate synthase domain-containing protein 3